jgi:hypothetical protein
MTTTIMAVTHHKEEFRVLASLGVYIPFGKEMQEFGLDQFVLNDRERFQFWAEVFGWKTRAQSPQGKISRCEEVRSLVSHIWCGSKDPEGWSCLWIRSIYYGRRRDQCQRFFGNLQRRINYLQGRWQWREERGTKVFYFWMPFPLDPQKENPELSSHLLKVKEMIMNTAGGQQPLPLNDNQ